MTLVCLTPAIAGQQTVFSVSPLLRPELHPSPNQRCVVWGHALKSVAALLDRWSENLGSCESRATQWDGEVRDPRIKPHGRRSDHHKVWPTSSAFKINTRRLWAAPIKCDLKAIKCNVLDKHSWLSSLFPRSSNAETLGWRQIRAAKSQYPTTWHDNYPSPRCYILLHYRCMYVTSSVQNIQKLIN